MQPRGGSLSYCFPDKRKTPRRQPCFGHTVPTGAVTFPIRCVKGVHMIHSIDPAACTGCGTCTKTCPLDVFRLEPAQEALSPCMAACPAGVDIRGNHYLIQQGHLGVVRPGATAASSRFRPSTGRVCFHPGQRKEVRPEPCGRGGKTSMPSSRSRVTGISKAPL